MTTSGISLEDLIASYPPSNTEGIQGIVAGKKEFSELSFTGPEQPPKAKGFYKYQELAKRIFQAFDHIYMFYAPGTGKTRSFGAIAEYYKLIHQTLLTNSHVLNKQEYNIKHSYVFVKSPGLERDFVNQIYKQFSHDYDTDKVQSARDTDTRNRYIISEIRKWYTIKTYGTFASKIRSRLLDPNLYEEYSDSLFFLDEVHYFSLPNYTKTVPNPTKENLDSLTTYEIFHILLHKVKRSKVILSSATPMTNYSSELGPILNLINPINMQIPGGTTFTKMNLYDLEPYLRGKIIHVPPIDTGVNVEYVGKPLNMTYDIDGTEIKSLVVADTTTMSEFQQQAYIKIWNANKLDQLLKTGPGTGKGGERGFLEKMDDARQASDFVFPDGTAGGKFPEDVKYNKKINNPELYEEARALARSKGLGRYVIKVKPDVYKASDEFSRLLGKNNIENIRKYSTKYAHIIETITKTRRKSFVYNELVSGSGIIVQSICFESMGYERFRSTISPFKILGDVGSKRASSALLNMDMPDEDDFGTRRMSSVRNTSSKTTRKKTDEIDEEVDLDYVDEDDEDVDKVDELTRRVEANAKLLSKMTYEITVPKKLRFAIITAETDNKVRENILSLFKCPENKHGEYIMVLIGSKLLRDGTNLENTLDIYMSAGWHESGMMQAMYRIIRAGSHADLLAELPEGEEITVKVHKLNASFNREFTYPPIPNNGLSIDEEFYKRSEIKDIDIRRMERFLAQVSLDCHLNTKRVDAIVEVADDYSRECGYQVCKYECFSPRPTRLDYRTYDLLYANDILQNVTYVLKKLFGENNYINIHDVYEKLPEHRAKYINLSIYQIIKNRDVIINKFGYASVLNAQSDILYLEYDPTGGNYEQLYYTTYMVIIKDSKLETYNNWLSTRSNNQLRNRIEYLGDIDDLEDKIISLFARYSANNVSDLVETIYIENIQTKWSKVFTGIFKNFIYKVREPRIDVEKSFRIMDKSREGVRGRRRDPNKPRVVDFELQPDEENGEEMYFHMVRDVELNTVAYSVNSLITKLSNRIRIYIPSEGLGWRDANEYEMPVYNTIKNNRYEERIERMNENMIYGTYLPDRKFRIINRYGEKERDCDASSMDKRCKNKGKIHSSWTKTDLRDLFVRLELVPDELDTDISDLTREELVELGNVSIARQEEYDDDQLRIYVSWVVTGLESSDMTDILLEYFKAKDLFFVM